MDGAAWWAAVHGVAKSRDTTERLHFHFSLSCIGEGNGNPLQCSGLENPRDGGAWWAAIYGVSQSRTRLKQLSSGSSSSVQLHSHVRLFATSWTAALQASLSHHQLLELAQTPFHHIGDAIQPSHPLLSPSPAFSLSQHQGLFQ